MARFSTIILAVICIVVGYWIFVLAVRTFIGTELPDPTDLLPYRWREMLPRHI
jgi:hypothetical protein